MTFTSTSPDMLLPIPDIGTELGPQYAIDINNCLTIIDAHSHLPGSGVPIVAAALNINADIPFNANNITGLRALRFTPQSIIPPTGLDLGELFESGVDLYYNDGAGNQIRITQSGGLAGTPGSIAGLVAPASATYVPLSGTFVWQSAANTPAAMDNGPVTIRNQVLNGKGVTLTPINALGADYTIILPALPAQQSFVTLDALGNMTAPWTVDNSTIKIVSNQLVATVASPQVFKANGHYRAGTQVDDLMFCKKAITITSIWIQNEVAGTAGTTEFDILAATTSGGSFTSILTTTGKITSAAGTNVWTDDGSIVGAQTGVTKPVLSTTTFAAGTALRFDLLQAMSGGANCSVTIFYQEN